MSPVVPLSFVLALFLLVTTCKSWPWVDSRAFDPFIPLPSKPGMNEHIRDPLSGSSLSDLRLILLGNIGCGKTSSADNILGQFSPVSPSASRNCQLRRHYSEGRNVTLVEAPRWYWNGEKMEDSVRKETKRAMTLVGPGPHAVLLLVPISQFTEVSWHCPSIALLY